LTLGVARRGGSRSRRGAPRQRIPPSRIALRPDEAAAAVGLGRVRAAVQAYHDVAFSIIPPADEREASERMDAANAANAEAQERIGEPCGACTPADRLASLHLAGALLKDR
jgi:hypothetical protein